LVVGGTVAGIAPVAVASTAAASCGTVAATQVKTTVADYKIKAGSHKADPDKLSGAQIDAMESSMDAAYNATLKTGVKQPKKITVPVVFHIVSSDGTRAGGNVPRSMIDAQMDVLNLSYGGHTGGAATRFVFQLKKVNRVVNPAWVPILSQDDFPDTSKELEMKKALRVGGAETLNMYIGNIEDGLLGWAYYPTKKLNPLDGVVILGESLPGGTAVPYDQGDTVTHEVGHWLNLLHTFEQGCTKEGDKVKDTPLEAEPQFGCPIGADTCTAPGEDPIHNFMDYSDDFCMYQFTPGQVNRMQKAWTAFRAP
jgi:hypothetical protein